MVGRVRVVIRPSGSHPDLLTVQDAMQQVLDVFELGMPDDAVAWKLVQASTNTPLTVVGEMVPTVPDQNVIAMVSDAAQLMAAGFSALEEGRIIDAWEPKIATVKRFLARNMNGVGRTDVDVIDVRAPVAITPVIAEKALRAVDEALTEEALHSSIDRARTEIGSVEGEILYVGTYYNHPAFRLLERKSRSAIWCVVPESQAEIISQHAQFSDVWGRRRVLARGRMYYDSHGHLYRIDVRDISAISSEAVSIDRLRDRDFTGGLSVGDYLEKFREGELG